MDWEAELLRKMAKAPTYDDRIWLECPKCGAEQEDCDGFGVLFCPECGYCTHSSITNNKCDLCKRKVKIYGKETK